MKPGVAATWLLLAVTLSLSCRDDPPAPSPVAGDAAGRGTLVGTISLAEGIDVPPPRVIENTTDPEVCGDAHRIHDVRLSADGRGVADAIVSVLDVPAEPSETSTVTLDNRDCRFSPRVAVATVGSLLESTNSDPVLHTTHLYGPREINLSLPRLGAKQRRPLAAAGLFVVKCDVHGWMEAYLRVDEHPRHAVTEASGAFRIDGIPAGSRRVQIWHPWLGEMEHEVEIRAGATASLEVQFEERPR